MGYVTASLQEIGRDAIFISESKGFTEADDVAWTDSDYIVPTRLGLIHSEVSEALEEFRVGDQMAFGVELADVIIRTASLAAGLGIDLDQRVQDKLAHNRGRPAQHGGKRI